MKNGYFVGASFLSCLLFLVGAKAQAGWLDDARNKLDDHVHATTGAPTPRHPAPGLPNPAEAKQTAIDFAVDVAKATGCDQCAKDIAKASADVQKLINEVANKQGYVLAAGGDLGLQIMVHLLATNSSDQGVAINTSDKTPKADAKHWDVTVDCLVQRSTRFDAYSVTEIDHMTDMNDGDILNITAKAPCQEYNIGTAKAVTSATVILSGEGEDPRAKTGQVKYYLIGRGA